MTSREPGGRGASPAALGYRMPAEWAPHAATWMAWPHNESDWPGLFDRIPAVFAEIIAHLCRVERVRLIHRPDRRDAIERRLAAAGVELARVDWFEADTNRSWTRDYVPTFVARPGSVAAVKWRFNGWSRYDDHEEDEAAGRQVADWLEIPAFLPAAVDRGRSRRVVLEGGALETDGEGTVLVSEECLLGEPYGRNPWLGKAGTARALAGALGARAVVWVGAGISGDDTFGHVDDFVRFVAPGRVVLCREEDSSDANYRPLCEAWERLEGALDARGRRLEIVPLPMPEPVVHQGDRLPASYANFYIANGLVLVPTFDDPADRIALGILSELFEGRRVVGVHSRDLVLGLGTIHCSTQQEPEKPSITPAG